MWDVDYQLPQFSTGEIDPVSERIGTFIADMIDDGDCLQLGIGGIPNGVLSHLGGKHDLGIHTEMFSDGVVELIEKGIINGARKNLHPGKLVSGFLPGHATPVRLHQQ